MHRKRVRQAGSVEACASMIQTALAGASTGPVTGSTTGTVVFCEGVAGGVIASFASAAAMGAAGRVSDALVILDSLSGDTAKICRSH